MAKIIDFDSHGSPRNDPPSTRNQELLAQLQAQAKAADTSQARLLNELRGMEATLLANHRQYVRLWDAARQHGIDPPVATAAEIIVKAADSATSAHSFERAKAEIAALKNWQALPETTKKFARQNSLDWSGGGRDYYSFMTSAERTESDIAALKNWQALPEDAKLFAMQNMVNWEGVHGGDYHTFMNKEVDFTRIPPETQQEITGLARQNSELRRFGIRCPRPGAPRPVPAARPGPGPRPLTAGQPRGFLLPRGRTH
jgi:hypothetical protein